MRFTVATAVDDYFVFDPQILGIEIPILVARSAEPTWKWFSTEAKTSILCVAAKLLPSRIVIGGEAPDAIPIAEYERLVQQFPTGYELKRYVAARVSAVIRQYTDASVDAELMLSNYLEKRITTQSKNYIQRFREAEIAKFEFLYSQYDITHYCSVKAMRIYTSCVGGILLALRERFQLFLTGFEKISFLTERLQAPRLKSLAPSNVTSKRSKSLEMHVKRKTEDLLRKKSEIYFGGLIPLKPASLITHNLYYVK